MLLIQIWPNFWDQVFWEPWFLLTVHYIILDISSSNLLAVCQPPVSLGSPELGTAQPQLVKLFIIEYLAVSPGKWIFCPQKFCFFIKYQLKEWIFKIWILQFLLLLTFWIIIFFIYFSFNQRIGWAKVFSGTLLPRNSLLSWELDV